MASVCPQFKVILCGEYGVGKTSFFRRFMSNTFIDTSTMSSSSARASTLGLDHFSRKFEVDGKSIKIQLWDTGGLERVASITNSYYKFAEAALLVFALDSLESFHCLSQHLLEILSMAENAKIFLIGNKLDLDTHEVTDEIVEMFVEQFPKFHGYFKISCKTNEGVDEMIQEVANVLSRTSYSFKDTFNTFTLHGTHIGGSCCSADHDNCNHGSTSGDGGGGSDSANTSTSCCAK